MFVTNVNGSAFATAPALPRVYTSTATICRRSVTLARKGGGKKKAKNLASKRSKPQSKPKSSALQGTPKKQPSSPTPEPSDTSSFPGPLAPDLLNAPIADLTKPQQDEENVESEALSEDSIELPVASEAQVKLPDISSVTSKGIRRKRKPRSAVPDVKLDGMLDSKGDTKDGSDVGEEERFSSAKIRELTAAYRRGGPEADIVIDEIEKDPDYMLQTGNAQGEYDLTSAIIGTGRPNKQGIYLLPYLQSGHVLLLIIILLCTFVYYPGFPLTELDDSVRLLLKRGIVLTYVVNAGLSIVAYQEAKKREQPGLFWGFKTAFLGNLALNELKQNAPLEEEKK